VQLGAGTVQTKDGGDIWPMLRNAQMAGSLVWLLPIREEEATVPCWQGRMSLAGAPAVPDAGRRK
jgi:hypothetical protein